jgi:uncharacterized SAM-binding protein YcdF (DUF218 family)
MKLAARLSATVAGALAFAWLAGFLWFVRDVDLPAPKADKADGIVVLTGGADRIATGLHLLQEGCCRLMLISGVGHGAELPALQHGTGVAATPLADIITLGRSATSTAGNADETAAWAHDNHLHSLMVVTAFYHMPRALYELSRTAPDLALIPVPVQPPAARRGGVGLLPLLAQEYTKLLGSALGLSRFEHGSETALRDTDRRDRA